MERKFKKIFIMVKTKKPTKDAKLKPKDKVVDQMQKIVVKKPNLKIEKPVLHQIKVKCSCGNEFETLSTAKDDLKVEICSKCHPLYTGTQKLVDTAGQVEKYNERLKKAKALQKKRHKKR